MKKLAFIFFVFQLFISSCWASNNGEKLLKEVEKNISNINSFYYETEYISINPNSADSIYQHNGKVWGVIVPGDSVFGCYFAVKSIDRDEQYEYYYDGKESIEVEHTRRKIIIFDPHLYPIDNRNPAIARMALFPFQKLIIDQNFVKSLLNENPEIKIKQDTDSSIKVISLHYPLNEYKQDFTRILYIDSVTKLINKIESIVNWNGITSRTSINIKDYSINNPAIQDSIKYVSTYSEYNTVNYEEEAKKISVPRKDLVGEIAPSFEYESFNSENISLNDFKGKIVLLDFWETWCGWCLNALPEINQLHKDYKESGVKVVGITTENITQINNLINKNNLEYINLKADQKILEDYDVKARPTYVLIDKTGKIVISSEGDLEVIKSKIEELL